MKENLNILDLNTSAAGGPSRDFINLTNHNQNGSTLLVSRKNTKWLRHLVYTGGWIPDLIALFVNIDTQRVD